MKFAGALAFLAVLCGAASLHAESLVTVGKPLTVVAPVEGRVVSVAGNVELRAPVRGDVVAWGGTVSIAPGGAVGGNVIAFGAEVHGSREAVAGRILTPGSLASLYLSEARRGPLHPISGRELPVLAGLRLLVLAIWAALSAIVLRLWGGRVARAALCFEENPAAAAMSGLAGVLFLFFLGVTAFSAFPAPLRSPSALVILGFAAALKVFGMTSFFLFLGQRFGRWASPRRRPAALVLGLLASGAISLVPFAGPILWSAISVVSVGAAVFTRFGAPRFRIAVA
jgi:hypothetical protein